LQTRSSLLIRVSLGAAVAIMPLASAASAQSDAYLERIWGGESRQVFSVEVGSDRHVFVAGDGPAIRHAVNPGASTTWELQTLPSDVTQNPLDVHFIEGTDSEGPEHIGFAVGLNGHVLTTVDYGTTWSHLDSGEVQNQLSPSENAALWRGRFLNEDDGFVLGLWTFQRWNGSAWSNVTLKDANNDPIDANRFEFYALELLIDPNDPDRWVGVAGGQLWGGEGGDGHPDNGVIFVGSSNVEGGNTWSQVLQLDAGEYQDPWDIEFEPNPATLGSAVGYLACGTSTDDGAVFRTTDSGMTWSLDHDDTTTLYGIAVLSADEAIATGYGGQIWARDSSGWTCMRGSGCTLPSGVTETHTTPLSGAHAAGSDVYVTGTSGYLRVSSNQFATNSTNLNANSADDGSQKWRFGDLAFSTEDDGYAVAAEKMIIESTDGGETWDFSASSPNTAVGSGNLPLTAVDFRPGGGIGVAVGYGRFDTLDPNTAPTITESFAYYKDENDTSPAWVAAEIDFEHPDDPDPEFLLLDDVAWAGGAGSTAEFWAVGRYGNGGAFSPTGVKPMLMRSTDGGATWSDATPYVDPGELLNGDRFSSLTFAAPTVGIVVGYNVQSGLPRAHVIHIPTSGSPSVSEIGVVGSEPMVDVAVFGTTAVAVGVNESFYLFVESHGEFWQFPVPSLGHSDPVNFTSVAFEAAGILIGATSSLAEADSPGLGKALFFDPSTSPPAWSVIPAGTNKNMHSIVLHSSPAGAAIGVAIAGFAQGLPGSSELGMAADTAIVRIVNPAP